MKAAQMNDILVNNNTLDETRRPLAVTALAALGVVYGDIGTSPLYAFKLAFNGETAILATHDHVLGVLSLIFWALIVVVTVKYLVFVLMADNNGEGGIIALVALLNPWMAKSGTPRYVLMIMGLFGAALLFGDGTITPAISVLSAVEGLGVENPKLRAYSVPITISILIVLFSVQRYGTARIGSLFGPVMLIWFLVLGLMGIKGILEEPRVFAALMPGHAINFLFNNGLLGFVVLGTVFLAVTGAEALYADIGHFGRVPIRAAWLVVALPALVLNYFGQGAGVLANPENAAHPFYHLSPDWAHYPLVGLATLATIIASQAVISGVFSLTRQAILLGQLPRIKILQTDSQQIGQIFIPFVNWVLMVATIALVLGFRTSDNLGAAYGLAVATDMVITSCLAFFVAKRFGWNLWLAGGLVVLFLIVDVTFLIANSFKFLEGGWYPVLAASLIFTLMTVWRNGIKRLRKSNSDERHLLETYLADIKVARPKTVAGTAVFPTARVKTTPSALLRIMEHMPVIHETTIILTVSIQDVPRVTGANRVDFVALAPGVYRIILRYGFMQSPNVPIGLRLCARFGLDLDRETTTYFVSLDDVEVMGSPPLQKRLSAHVFAFLWRNGPRLSDLHSLPLDRMVVIGHRLKL
ncbi:potassium transporter Kup [Aliiroseovarius sp. 2305UL8-7]|uniref:potassium transporter Kup n=1 Tax=Aliiroseovarius conchicola TaxID=3121637 RepID=UPI003528FC62